MRHGWNMTERKNGDTEEKACEPRRECEPFASAAAEKLLTTWMTSDCSPVGFERTVLDSYPATTKQSIT